MLAKSDELQPWNRSALWSEIRGCELSMPKSTRCWEIVRAEIMPHDGKGVHWYSVHCAGSPDDRLKEVVTRIGWEIYMPTCMELRAVPKRQLPPSQRNSPFPVRKPTEVKMFPRYPFLRFDLRDDKRHDVFTLLGVQGMICDESAGKPQPAYIHESVINAFKSTEETGSIPLGTTVKQLAFAIGEAVRISYGPFAGQNATVEDIPDVPIERLDENSRLRLLISLFGRATPIEISIADIERL